MSGGSLSPERFATDLQGAATNFDVVRSSNTTLLLDIDDPVSKAQFDRLLPKVKEVFGVSAVEEWKSKSGNTHIAVTLETPLPAGSRLALQAALGSDAVREVLAVARLMNGVVEPSVLFRPKVTVPAV